MVNQAVVRGPRDLFDFYAPLPKMIKFENAANVPSSAVQIYLRNTQWQFNITADQYRFMLEMMNKPKIFHVIPVVSPKRIYYFMSLRFRPGLGIWLHKICRPIKMLRFTKC